MQLLSKSNKEICILLCAINIHSKHVWVVPLKDNKYIKITNVFQKILDDQDASQRKYR